MCGQLKEHCCVGDRIVRVTRQEHALTLLHEVCVDGEVHARWLCKSLHDVVVDSIVHGCIGGANMG